MRAAVPGRVPGPSPGRAPGRVPGVPGSGSRVPGDVPGRPCPRVPGRVPAPWTPAGPPRDEAWAKNFSSSVSSGECASQSVVVGRRVRLPWAPIRSGGVGASPGVL